jgi:hypothetical protein
LIPQTIEGLRIGAVVRARSAWWWGFMQAAGLAKLLDDRSPEAIGWSSAKMWTLYRNIRSRCPQRVMELGTGCSTVVIAEALRRNGMGHLVTVDANERWLGETEKSLSPALRRHVTLHHSPIVVDAIEGEACHRYVDLPDQPLDFLYVDGPDRKDVPGWTHGKPVAADPLHLEPEFSPGFRMLFEKRSATIAFLRRHLRRRYRVRHDRYFLLTSMDLES